MLLHYYRFQVSRPFDRLDDLQGLRKIKLGQQVRLCVHFPFCSPLDVRVVTDPNDPALSIDAPHYLTVSPLISRKKRISCTNTHFRTSTRFMPRATEEKELRSECKMRCSSLRNGVAKSHFFSLDTGVDFDHPVLGGGKWGPGNKVIGGYDFVGDAYNGAIFLQIFNKISPTASQYIYRRRQ